MTDANQEALTDQHLMLVHDESIPKDTWDQFCREIEMEGLRFLRKPTRPIGPQASWEVWTLPLIMLFIAKSYFDGFLREAGRRHYGVLEDSLGRLRKRLFFRRDGIRFAVLRSDGEVKTEFSPLFAIYSKIEKGKSLKLMFRSDCSEQEYLLSIRLFLRLLDSHHRCLSHPDIDIDIDSEEGQWGQVVVSLDRETETLRVVRFPWGEAKSKRSKES